MVCYIGKLPPRNTGLYYTAAAQYPSNHTTFPPTLFVDVGLVVQHQGHLVRLPAQRGPATGARRDAGRVVSPPILSARLHESSLSPAGLPKYDLFSP
jgi:hypothetical protein